LKLARERRDAARALVAAGVDPNNERKAKRAARENTFEAIALEWLQVQEKSLSAKTFRKKKDRLSSTGDGRLV
jgi:hypothetical protein